MMISDSLFARFSKRLSTPDFTDENKTRTAVMMNIILWAALVLLIFGGAALLITMPNFRFTLTLLFIFFCIIFINLVLLHRGYVYEAIAFFSFSIWSLIAALAYFYGGVRSVSYSALIIPILIAGLLLGGRGGFFFAIANAVVGIGFVTIEVGKSSSSVDTPLISVWLSSTIIFLLTALLLSLTSFSVKNELHRSGQEIKEREQTEIALRQAKEIAESANKAKSEYVSVVSHELKGPLSTVVGYTELLKEGVAGALTDDQMELLKMVEVGSDLMVSMISDLTDISRIESGNLPLQLAAVDSLLSIQKVQKMLESHLESKNQTLIVDLPSNLPMVCADHARLNQILMNLINNAHKYTPADGSIWIKAWTEGEMMFFSVRDNGIGIDEAELPLVFQQFYRSPDDEARRETGTGLGLNITRQLVELQGGDIWVESVFREGTTFNFVLPIYRETA